MARRNLQATMVLVEPTTVSQMGGESIHTSQLRPAYPLRRGDLDGEAIVTLRSLCKTILLPLASFKG